MSDENADDVVLDKQDNPAPASQPPIPAAVIPRFPTPAKPPNIPKHSAGAGPVKYTTLIEQSVEPKSDGGNGYHGTQQLPKPTTTEHLIDQIGENGLSEFTVRVWSMNPYTELLDGQGNPSVPQGPYAVLVEHLREAYGVGSYQIRIEHHGIIVPRIGNRLIRITGAPGQATQAIIQQQQPQPIGPIQQRMLGYSPQWQQQQQQTSTGGLDDEVRRLQVERQKLSVMREIKREEMALRKETEALQRGEVEPENEKVKKLEAELAELKAKLDKPEKKDDKTLELVMGALTALITAQVNKPKDDSLKDMVALMVETNKSVMASANEKSGEFKELAMTLLTKKLDSNEDQLKTYLDLMDRGESRAMKMVEMMRGDDGHIDIDPDRPWASLGAQVVAKGVNALIDAFRSGGPLADIIAAKIGKSPSSVTQEDLGALAEKLKHVEPLRPKALPPRPQPQQQHLQAPAAQSVLPAPMTFDPQPVSQSVSATETTMIAAETPPAEAATQTVPSAPSATTPIATPPAAAPQVTVGLQTPDIMEQDLREKVDICIEDYLLVDLTAERPEHDWPSYAADKWPKEFKATFVGCPDHEARIALIKSKCNPELWLKVEALLKKEGSPNLYCFQLALNALVSEITGITATPEPGVATAIP